VRQLLGDGTRLPEAPRCVRLSRLSCEKVQHATDRRHFRSSGTHHRTYVSAFGWSASHGHIADRRQAEQRFGEPLALTDGDGPAGEEPSRSCGCPIVLLGRGGSRCRMSGPRNVTTGIAGQAQPPDRFLPVLCSVEHWPGIGIGALRFVRCERAMYELGLRWPVAASVQSPARTEPWPASPSFRPGCCRVLSRPRRPAKMTVCRWSGRIRSWPVELLGCLAVPAGRLGLSPGHTRACSNCCTRKRERRSASGGLTVGAGSANRDMPARRRLRCAWATRS
jgi:hypothetical protein